MFSDNNQINKNTEFGYKNTFINVSAVQFSTSQVVDIHHIPPDMMFIMKYYAEKYRFL